MKSALDEQIREFSPVDGSFLPLEGYFEEAFSSADPSEYYDAIFNLFERFPDDDGAGVFWSALHGMEAVGGYEEKLLAYFQRYPSEMTRTMLRRIRNSGVKQIGTTTIEGLL
ncbi:hypothetical protein SAMN02745181_0490 [Rubritalea squalenifaciens DSM 18772]|uniref:Uncharacterized protein n=1 Tax=Rubritalea squalenifaciens DSM 18772 TaxID=1123071 RepID=A0A1M6CIQ5_9BACT|nr:hypothetical protein [Rubritalea squalenifaciens]SHI60877.1 hypothetical protein SAMN02745181_0490 [Rubritalea squalenifaciens DSM 18772]